MTETTENFQFQLGRRPNDPIKPRLRLSTLLTGEAPTVPENVDWLSRVTVWPMYLNDRIGDCTCATAGHMIQNITAYGEGTEETITDNDVLTAYEAVSGYNPYTGENDNGAIVQDVLNYWRKAGIGGHNILAFAEVDYNNKDELHAAVNLFGNIYLGIAFPESGFDQFYNGEPWDVVPNSRIVGGHAINSGWYDISDGKWKIISWGQVVEMTQAFWDEYVEEAWVVISEEWLDANGRNPAGIDMDVLGNEFTRITGESDPFGPQPIPTPVENFWDTVEKWWKSLIRWFKRHFGHKA